MRITAKVSIYLVLIAGAAMFILPFAWMVLTALKPLNQTLQQSHLWLPRRFEAPLGGRMQEVWPGAAVAEPTSGRWSRARPSRSRFRRPRYGTERGSRRRAHPCQSWS